ncbi:TBC1 domain family member 25-like isoform X1 [Haliotis rufescens]|uniref:TBC1 domain family member 25-like isoform X1 n=2 Tax=Haliotis rufescens TaxID=6454 RepID=UPI001EAFE4A0|nr:TBC1 domain family member 25-like isoform X1 [Haliotis rufescens]
MAGFYNLENREVIRVKVKKCDGMLQPEYKKFSVDPQITSFEMLQGILARAFDIKGDFTVGYLAPDSEGQEVYLSMLSDWDMDAAFQCASDPYLKLKVDLKPFEDGLDDWDVIAPADIPQHKVTNILDKASLLGAITGTITSQVGKTMTTVQRAMGLKQTDEELYRPMKPPMSDMEFHNYLDSGGFMIKPQEFRLSIYQGGIEPSLRRVTWRHLLNIFPANLSGKERFDYLKGREREYYRLRDEWKERFSTNTATEEVKYVASMVKKDVLRTDRTHKFYAGGDENKNILSLFHILVTYSLTHPDVSYCQGMSDIASPILVTQKDEAQAYLCFCGVMKRLKANFLPSGATIMTKFSHLAHLLQLHDPDYFTYLQNIAAGDLFFCYRWLLLELKREFPLDDALYMLEVMLSTLPPDPPQHSLELTDEGFNFKYLSTSPCSPSFSFQQTVYAKLLAMRRQGSSIRSNGGSVPNELIPGNSANNNSVSTFDASPIDERKEITQDYPRLDDPDTRAMQRRSTSIDRHLEDTAVTKESGSCENDDGQCASGSVDSSELNGMRGDRADASCECEDDFNASSNDSGTGATPSDASIVEDNFTEVEGVSQDADKADDADQQMQFHLSLENKPETPVNMEKQTRTSFFGNMKKLISSPKRRPANITIPKEISSHSEGEANNKSDDMPSAKGAEQSQGSESGDGEPSVNSNNILSASKIAQKLPPPHEFGCGNPFLMFLCLTLLLQHRNHIMRNKLDYEEVAMHFDRMVRRHSVHKVLHTARQLYSEYLRTQQMLSEKDADDSGLSV